LDTQWLQSPASRTGLSSPLDLTVVNSAPGHYSRYCADHYKLLLVKDGSSWTPKGYSRTPVGLGSLRITLGHPRVIVARQSDWALFTLGHPRVSVVRQSDSALFTLGHPRVTVVRQSDWALFTLGLNLAKFTTLTICLVNVVFWSSLGFCDIFIY
jgi:hypothetical protein